VIEIAPATDLRDVRALFTEYAASIGFSLAFQRFDEEVATLPGRYAPPDGRILIARVDGHLAGCVALRRLDEHTCEMKRLFVRPAFAGRGVGRALAEAIIAEASTYRAMRLDTVPSMRAAIALYESLGFRDITPNTSNPMEGARFMELTIAATSPRRSTP
jgi:putative acetyltransferase